MSKFSNFKIKWPKSVKKLENGGRLGPLRQNVPPPPPPKRSAGSASALELPETYRYSFSFISLFRQIEGLRPLP